ncbi:class I ribonucleotide reductase maintenance protein YfaE [Thalassotalea sp. PS06]|uniref:class I ribonucleotide reductase maintenance protein YfaE n=1 Tax=Thalassotalea sp. PS06 TaxID=2594005 RepID=UPI0028C4E0E3|nr:class I ribonucleotide reductase maintenance protein YfaE [Thalassotalea sp. PS06]
MNEKVVESEFDHHTHKNLLEFFEQHNIEAHYHCRDGFCGACRVDLLEGSTEYTNGEPLAFIRDGEILLCCSVPTSDIKISCD